jgi:[protein-PII] uridylyltransferase
VLQARGAIRPAIADFPVAPDVVVDNSLSNVYTVIEVSGLDRGGLLYDLTNAISKLNLNIASAHITTFGERAVDAFYVTDLTGAKVISPQRQATIRRLLLEVFPHGQGPPAGGAAEQTSSPAPGGAAT